MYISSFCFFPSFLFIYLFISFQGESPTCRLSSGSPSGWLIPHQMVACRRINTLPFTYALKHLSVQTFPTHTFDETHELTQTDRCVGVSLYSFLSGMSLNTACMVGEGTPWQINRAMCVRALRKWSHVRCDESHKSWFELTGWKQFSRILISNAPLNPDSPPDAHETLSLSC